MPISKRPEQLAWLAFGYALVFLVGSISFAAYSGSRLLHVAIFHFTLATLFSFVAWWHTYLVRRAQEEANDIAATTPEARDRELFGDQEAVLQLAADAHRVFDRYFLTSFTVVAGLGTALIAGWIGMNWLHTPAALQQPPDMVGIAGLCGFLLVFNLLAGSYFNGLSREPGCRWLRPVAQWLLFSGLAYAAGVAVTLGFSLSGFQWDTALALAFLVGIVVLGLEMGLNFVLEFYRPRLPGEEEKPLYESRLLGFVTEPGGIAHNVATALDYQFGFKVSETWFYRFTERAVIPIVAVGIVALYLLDMFVVVDSQQLALLETSLPGSAMTTSLVEPGLHFKLPRPYQCLERFDVGKVREVVIGYSDAPSGQSAPGAEGGDPTGRVIVWDKEHVKKEVNFITASHEAAVQQSTIGATPTATPLPAAAIPGSNIVPGASAPAASRGVQNVPVNILNGNLTIQYDIMPTLEGLQNYARNYADPEQMLSDVAQRQFVAYLAHADLLDLIGANMKTAQVELATRIDDAVKALDPPLGVRVRYVGFAGLHPPQQVAMAFQNVIGARERSYTAKLEGEAYGLEKVAQAQGRSSRVLLDAQSYSVERVQNALGDKQQFTEQLVAYESAPSIFMLRKQLELLEAQAKGLRKYVVAGDSKEVYILDLGEKLRPDMLQDVDLNAPMK